MRHVRGRRFVRSLVTSRSRCWSSGPACQGHQLLLGGTCAARRYRRWCCSRAAADTRRSFFKSCCHWEACSMVSGPADHALQNRCNGQTVARSHQQHSKCFNDPATSPSAILQEDTFTGALHGVPAGPRSTDLVGPRKLFGFRAGRLGSPGLAQMHVSNSLSAVSNRSETATKSMLFIYPGRSTRGMRGRT